jgi:adenylate kinase
MKIVMMGPPGAGKGTQARIIAERLGIPAISTGDIFRANVTAQTELGREAKRYMDSGDYVPDELTNAMVRDRVAESDAAAGFLLDGYPRTVAQVHELDAMLEERGHPLDVVLVLTVDQDEIVQRLVRRAEAEGRSEQTAPLLQVYDDRGLLVAVDGMGDVEEVTTRVLKALDQTDGAPAS